VGAVNTNVKGGLAEIEEASSLEPYMADIDELLTLALQPRKDHLGGVDTYLAKKMCEKRPEDIKVAMSRLCLGLNHSVPVSVHSILHAMQRWTPNSSPPQVAFRHVAFRVGAFRLVAFSDVHH
jgi:hypothetical protein